MALQKATQRRFRLIFWLNVTLISCTIIGFIQVADFELRQILSGRRPTSLGRRPTSLGRRPTSWGRRPTTLPPTLVKNVSVRKEAEDLHQPLKPINRKRRRQKQSPYEGVEEYLLKASYVRDLHFSEVEILDLLDWEMESLEGIVNSSATMDDAIRTCNPPRHISKACCIGTYSSGGDIDWKLRAPLCANKTLEDYNYVRETAREFLEDSASEVAKTPCDVCRIVELQQKHNLTIVLFGDSVSNQVIQGLTCELQRRNYLVDINRKFSKDQRCKRCIKWVTTATVTSARQPTAHPATIKFMFQYRYPFIYPHEEDIVATAGDILVVNFGLHWNFHAKIYDNHRSHYRKSYGQFLMQLQRKGNFTLLFHRETTAQHFDALAGDYSLRSVNSSSQCVPVKYDVNVSAWRESMVYQATKKALYKYVRIEAPLPGLSRNAKRPELLVIPYYNFTALHHNMHPSKECSHFCSSPFIYYPVWRSIRLAMDRQYGK